MTTMTTRTPGGEFESSLEDADLAAEAAHLRALRLSYREIAARQGVSPATAHRRVKQALAAVPVEAVGELRKIEGDILDSALQELLVMARGGTRAERVLVYREIRMNRESYRRLMGTDMPQQHVVRVADPIAEEIERLARELDVLDPSASETVPDASPVN